MRLELRVLGSFGGAALAALACGCGDETIPGDSGGSGDPAPVTENLGHPPAKKPPANVVGGFSITLPSMKLAPGAEKEPCYIFPLEIQGPSRFVGGGELTVGPGMHHGNITTRPKTGEGIRKCPKDGPGADDFVGLDILAGGAVLFGSSTQIDGTEWQSFPDGMAYRVRDGFEIVARMHYLNATSEELTVTPKYEWFTIDEATLTQEVAPFAWENASIAIPPKASFTSSATCVVPKPMHIVQVLPHMHKLGTAFTASFAGGAADGKLFLDSRGYDPVNGVIVQYEPPIDLSQGTGASFSCAWKNTLDKPIEWGIGDNEMCILFGYAYPPENAYSESASDTSCVYVAPPAP